jgi:tetratricopeptide (TPR) repeat protein
VSLGTALPWANREPRSAAMAAVAVQADGRIRHGVRLAERGAFYSARAEFVAALQLIAQASDAQQDTRLYTSSLVSGLTAIREASVFVRSNSANGAIDLKRIIAGHKTPVLKHATENELTATLAAQKYYTYAQEQLAVSASQEMTASMALFGLGKAAISGISNQPLRKLEYTAQAMALYQAALMAAPRNFRAANELGVLLAESGNLPRSRDVLIHSVTLSPQAATWLNLQVVHARMGEYELAERARQQAELLRPAGSGPVVQWVDAAAFARAVPAGDGLTPPSAAQPTTQTSKTSSPSAASANVAKKGISDWLPKNLRR